MKKKIILLPLLLLGLTACDGLNINDLMGGNNSNNNGNQEASSRERLSIDANDLAIKVADLVSVFPEIGDELDMSEYISFDTGTDYRLEQFTFESLNPDVISIENYHARCLKQGFAIIKVSGPGLNTPVEITFYVGSIAGNYVPFDSKALAGVISLNIAEGTNGYNFDLNVVSNGKKYNNRDIISYSGSGTLIKNISPFLPFDFNGEAPSSFEPVTNYVTELVPEAAEFEELGEDLYGFMVADADEGILIKVRYNEKFITLAAE